MLAAAVSSRLRAISDRSYPSARSQMCPYNGNDAPDPLRCSTDTIHCGNRGSVLVDHIEMLEFMSAAHVYDHQNKMSKFSLKKNEQTKKSRLKHGNMCET